MRTNKDWNYTEYSTIFSLVNFQWDVGFDGFIFYVKNNAAENSILLAW